MDKLGMEHSAEWKPGDDVCISYPEIESRFLTRMHNAGFLAFRSQLGLAFGAWCPERFVQVIHRGMSRRWEIVLSNSDMRGEVIEKITTDFDGLTDVAEKWLTGFPVSEVKKLLDDLQSDRPVGFTTRILR